MDTVDALKEQAGIAACEFVKSGMKVGLGTGSTVKYTVIELGRMIKEDDNTITGKQAAEAVPLSNKIGHGGTKPDNRWKIEASKNFTIAPAYNKGPYMVVAKEDIKTAGRKI